MDAIQEKLNRLPGVLLPWYRENRRVLPWREQVSACCFCVKVSIY